MKLALHLLTFLSFSLIFSAELSSQNSLPGVNGVDLNNKKVSIPSDLKGRKSLVGFAISPKIQDELVTWIQPIYDELIDPNSLASLVYDCEVMLVICFNKTNIQFKDRVEKELLENILPECYKNVILTEAESKKIEEALDIQDKSRVNLYTLNKEGGITSHTTGAYTESKFDKLSSHLEID